MLSRDEWELLEPVFRLTFFTNRQMMIFNGFSVEEAKKRPAERWSHHEITYEELLGLHMGVADNGKELNYYAIVTGSTMGHGSSSYILECPHCGEGDIHCQQRVWGNGQGRRCPGCKRIFQEFVTRVWGLNIPKEARIAREEEAERLRRVEEAKESAKRRGLAYHEPLDVVAIPIGGGLVWSKMWFVNGRGSLLRGEEWVLSETTPDVTHALETPTIAFADTRHQNAWRSAKATKKIQPNVAYRYEVTYKGGGEVITPWIRNAETLAKVEARIQAELGHDEEAFA